VPLSRSAPPDGNRNGLRSDLWWKLAERLHGHNFSRSTASRAGKVNSPHAGRGRPRPSPVLLSTVALPVCARCRGHGGTEEEIPDAICRASTLYARDARSRCQRAEGAQIRCEWKTEPVKSFSCRTPSWPMHCCRRPARRLRLPMLKILGSRQRHAGDGFTASSIPCDSTACPRELGNADGSRGAGCGDCRPVGEWSAGCSALLTPPSNMRRPQAIR